MNLRTTWGLSLMLAGSVFAADLPLREVVLFTSGVGYFERGGDLTGDAVAELAFSAKDLPDVIKSLTVMDDDGGRISGVTYETRDPLSRTLQSFRIDLSANRSLVDLLGNLRGVTVAVQAGSTSMTGEILGVETRTRREGEERFTESFLNLYSEGALRTVSLDQVQRIEPMDPELKKDFAAALAVLAGALDQDKRAVRLSFTGEGDRTVRVAYMLEAPVWKTSYRLVIEEDGSAWIQGWAHVENMTDEDWTGVQLELVSGQPISFIQNLYDPIYRQRPVVEYELAGITAPPMYDGVMEAFESFGDVAMAPAVPQSMAMAPARFGGRAEAGRIQSKAMAESVAVAAEGREVGELFSYPIADPVNLPRRQAAMLPIVGVNLTAERVSIFNESVQAKHPLNGIEVKNDTGLFLMQGPVTVFEDGVYAGDARLNDTPRGETRLLSYAVDLAAEVSKQMKTQPDQITRMKIANGTMEITRSLEQVATYTVRNQRDTERTFLIEHPLRPDWDLVAPVDNVEKTRDLYRIRVDVAGGEAVEVPVVERRLLTQTHALHNANLNWIEIQVTQSAASPELKKALQTLVDMRLELDQVVARRADRERRMQAIVTEQARIRENMKTVSRPSDAYAMWERRLVEQESELDQLRSEAEALRVDEQRRREAIDVYLAKLDV